MVSYLQLPSQQLTVLEMVKGDGDVRRPCRDKHLGSGIKACRWLGLRFLPDIWTLEYHTKHHCNSELKVCFGSL